MTQKTYRHRLTGVVRRYPESMAKNFPDLIEVVPGTKPLAFTPIPEEAVKSVSKKAAKPAPADAEKAEEN